MPSKRLKVNAQSQERELQSALGTPSTANSHTASGESTQLGAIFFNFSIPAPGSPSLHPTVRQATQLWRMFVSDVNPLMKILHIPTMEATFFAALSEPAKVGHSRSALLFAIYLSVINSLEPNDVMSLLDQPKNAALSKYKIGLEQSLAAANFLEVPNIESIQAIALYIVSTSYSPIAD